MHLHTGRANWFTGHETLGFSCTHSISHQLKCMDAGWTYTTRFNGSLVQNQSPFWAEQDQYPGLVQGKRGGWVVFHLGWRPDTPLMCKFLIWAQKMVFLTFWSKSFLVQLYCLAPEYLYHPPTQPSCPGT